MKTHEAIIPPDRRELAQYALYVCRRTDSTGTANPLTGKLVCAGCGALMHNRRSKAGKAGRRSDDSYDCTTCSHSNGCCGHYISAENVRKLVLQAIRSVVRYAIGNEAEFAEKVREVSALRHADEIREKRTEAVNAKRRIDELDAITRTLCEPMPRSSFATGYSVFVDMPFRINTRFPVTFSMSNAVLSFSNGEVLPEFLHAPVCLLRQTVFLAKSSASCLIDIFHEGKRFCKPAELAVCHCKVVHGSQ